MGQKGPPLHQKIKFFIRFVSTRFLEKKYYGFLVKAHDKHAKKFKRALFKIIKKKKN